MSGRWRRVERMPIALDKSIPFAVERYMIVAIDKDNQSRNYGASTRDEAQDIAAHLRNTDVLIVAIYRVEDSWKRQ